MDLYSALNEFCETFSRSSENFGIAKFSSTPINFSVSMTLGKALEEYYSRIILEEKTQVGAQFQLRLFSIEELESAQEGRRWTYTPNGQHLENSRWNKDWIVIADRNGDPLVVDSSNGSVHGLIQTRSLPLAKDISSFFDALTEGMKIEMDKYNFEVTDDDFNPLESFLRDVEQVATRKLKNPYDVGFLE